MKTAETLHSWDVCPVCVSNSHSHYVSFDALAFVQCDVCATVFKQFERVELRPADFYEASYFHGRKSGRDKRFEHRVSKAKRWINAARVFAPQAKSLLDVGCSFGYVVEAGNRLGLASAGVDVSAYAVKHCTGLNLTARQGDLESIPFETGRFDLCVMKHVLEHTPSPGRALAETRRVLSPNGVVLIAVPDVSYWKGDKRRETYRYYRPDDLGQQHYVYYGARSLRRLLESNGFEVLADRKDFRRPGLLGALAFSGKCLGFGVARALHLQRELFFIARKTR
ncbi:MAG: methyltransferase domain-containing protein [Myxococcaceae bacterium]